jgi:hypothetical protein
MQLPARTLHSSVEGDPQRARSRRPDEAISKEHEVSGPYHQPGWPQQPGGAGQPYGQPPQQPGGAGPTPQDFGPTGYGYPSESPVKRGNGLSTAALVFGIIGGIPLGIGFGIAGLARAAKVQSGKVRSWFGIILSVLWLIPFIIIGTDVASHVSKALDPGCIAGKESITNIGDKKLKADADNPDAVLKDIEDLAAQLNDAAAKSKNDAARTAIKKLADDFNEEVTTIKNGEVPSDALLNRIETDAKAVDDACGTIGS